MAIARAGIDLRLSENSRVTLSGSYGEQGAWTARLSVGFGIGTAVRRPAPLPGLEGTPSAFAQPCG